MGTISKIPDAIHNQRDTIGLLDKTAKVASKLGIVLVYLAPGGALGRLGAIAIQAAHVRTVCWHLFAVDDFAALKKEAAETLQTDDFSKKEKAKWVAKEVANQFTCKSVLIETLLITSTLTQIFGMIKPHAVFDKIGQYSDLGVCGLVLSLSVSQMAAAEQTINEEGMSTKQVLIYGDAFFEVISSGLGLLPAVIPHQQLVVALAGMASGLSYIGANRISVMQRKQQDRAQEPGATTEPRTTPQEVATLQVQ